MAAKHLTLDARCPNTGKVKAVKLMEDDLEHVRNNSPAFKFYELSGDKMTYKGSCVQEVLLSPKAILGGVRQFRRGGFCYVGMPTRRWFNSGSQGPPPTGMVFCVYLSDREEVFEWRWEPADPAEPDLPKDYKNPNRFADGKIWPKN
jgi:hypothetical protein